jgi:FAD/FMN-containing dehydrogenase
MVCGMDDEIYMALYSAWKDPADDERYGDWAGSNMAAMSHLATCTALADENLGRRPSKFITDQNMARLDAVRAAYDPENRFHSWMGRP